MPGSTMCGWPRASRTRATNTTWPIRGPGSDEPDLMAALDAIDDWPVPAAAAAVIGTSGVLASHGDTARTFALASLTKPLVARAAQIAVGEGAADLAPRAGPPDSTVRHLLARASALPMGSERLLVKP